MSVTVAKSAGFCFGVNRAVELVEQAAARGGTVVTLGPIIHNRHAVAHFEAMGVHVIDTPEEAPARKSRSRRRSKDRSATTADEEPVSPTPQGEADAEDARRLGYDLADSPTAFFGRFSPARYSQSPPVANIADATIGTW